MSNSNSFGGKLKKVLASMCSFVVGASGVSQAGKPGTKMPDKLTIGKDANSFGFEGFGWRLESKVGTAKKENSWLFNSSDSRYQRCGEAHGVNFDFGFSISSVLCSFDIWRGDDPVRVTIPKGVLFDVMRYFELNYYPIGNEARDNGTELSCKKGKLNDKTEDEVFLRFILWAFCGSPDAIDPNSGSSVQELKDGIFEFAVNKDNPNKDNFVVDDVKAIVNGTLTDKKYGVLKSGYFVEIFKKRVREVYMNTFEYNAADMDCMFDLIAQLNEENKDLKNQHTSRYLLSALGGLTVGGILTEGAHHFLGAKRSRSSEVNKGKSSGNKKGGQKTKKNLKKQKS